MKKLLIIIAFFALCLLIFLKPIEKIVWSVEQSKITTGDNVIYSQWSDRFGWKGRDIFTAYKMDSYQFSYGITDEEYRFTKENELDYNKAFAQYNTPPIKDIQKVGIEATDIPDSEFSFLLNNDLDDYWGHQEHYSDKTLVFYVLEDKYLISRSHREISEDYVNVDIYDIKSGTKYYYPTGTVANKPANTEVSERLVAPEYYMCSDGRLFCTYKCYNKLYCHSMN